MDSIIEGLVEKVGISKEQADKVIEYLKENSGQVVEWLQEKGITDAVKDKLPGGLGGLF
jgi:hypothetical protein